MLREFVTTVFVLAVAGRWDDLREYFSLVRELLALPSAQITPGQPTDK